MDEQTIRQRLKAFIQTELIRDQVEFADDEGIISGGLIDSLALAQIGVFAEDQFGVYIPDPDLTVAKMDTLNQMVARILRDLPA